MISWQKFMYVFVFMGAWTTCLPFNPQDAEKFEAAFQAYKQEKFQDAYQLYSEISNPTAKIYFNMGNCAFKLNKLGRSLWHWRQAELRWGFFDRDDLYQNLDLVREKLFANKKDSHSLIKSKKFFERGIRFIHIFPLWFIQVLFLIAWTILFVFVKRLFRQKQKALLVLLFSFVVLLGALILYNQVRRFYPRAVIVDQSATLYSGPSTTYQKLGVLPEGSEVCVDKQRQDFCKVKKKGASGWIVRSALGFI